jgi:hypothetical protein
MWAIQGMIIDDWVAWFLARLYNCWTRIKIVTVQRNTIVVVMDNLMNKTNKL